MVAPVPVEGRMQLAQNAFAVGNFDEAFFQARLVAKSCKSCISGSARELCRCRDLIAGCMNGTHAFCEELRRTCHCPALANARCDDPIHHEALLYLGRTAIYSRRYEEGMVYAQKLITLSPKHSEAYLQLGLLLQFCRHYSAAVAVHNQGLKRLRGKDADQSQIRILEFQFLRGISSANYDMRKVDPFNKLPNELKVMVFQGFSLRTLILCLRVSKRWNAFLTATPSLWTHQHFENPKTVLRLFPMERYMKRYAASRVTSLQLDDCDRLGITPKRFIEMVELCPQLEHLRLDKSTRIRFREFPAVPLGSRFRTLFLGPELYMSAIALKNVITWAANTLEELTILQFPERPAASPPWPQIPNLHTIRIAAPRIPAASADAIRSVDMEHIMAKTPNVTTAWIDEMNLEMTRDTVFPVAATLWQRLQHLFVGNKVNMDPRFLIKSAHFFTHLPQSVTEIVLHKKSTNPGGIGLLMGLPDSITPGVAAYLPNLRTVSLKSTHILERASYKRLLKSPLTHGALQELELHPFPWNIIKDGGAKWLAGESVTLLGIRGLVAEHGHHVDDPETALLGLLGRFPNLHTLDIGEEPLADATLGKIVKSGITTIYHQRGAAMTDFTEWAKGKGARVVHGKCLGTSATSAGVSRG